MRIEVSLMSHPFQENPVWPGMEEIAAAAREVEELGFDGALVPEAGGHDPFFPLLIAAGATRRISLCTGIAVAFPRSPMVMAQIAWDLQHFSGGRFQLGLGTQVKAHNDRRYAAPWTAPPGPRLREYLLCMRAMFATFCDGAHPTFFTGKHYQFTLMAPFFNPGPIAHPHVPVYIAAVNPYMARLAGEVCDGLFPHPICTPKYIREEMMPRIEAGAHKAGRPVSAVAIQGSPMIVTGKNRAEVAHKTVFVKQRLGFYAATKAYHPALAAHGFLDVGERLLALSREAKWEEMVALIPDEMMREFTTIATFDELGGQLRERWGGLLSALHIDLPAELRANKPAVRKLLADLRAA